VSVSARGVARLGFGEGLQQWTAGFMPVRGIRQQIQTTFMWMSGATSVILSVEGEAEGNSAMLRSILLSDFGYL